MRKVLAIALLALMVTGANAENKKDSVNKINPFSLSSKKTKITSIKDQNRMLGTCWDYSTLSFFESEILKRQEKTFTTSERCS